MSPPATDRLDLFDRWPSDAARYNDWGSRIRAAYGSVTNFICQKRLHWQVVPEAKRELYSGSIFAYASEVPFAQASDYRILRNDWPYRWENGVTHMVVWLKNRVPIEADTGKVSAEGRDLIERFVHERFVKELGEGGAKKVLWFKNWAALQSVAALEHFHVLVRDVPEWRVLEWTQGDTTKLES